jgi:ribosomal protein L34
MSLTFRAKKIPRKRKHGFRAVSAKILQNRRRKGRKKLSV